MTSAFQDSLPSELVKHVTSICGQAGVEWLNALEDRVGELAQLWSVEVDTPFAAGEFNFVAPARRTDGEPTVIKLSPPYETVEIHAEAEYLRCRDGNGAVRLLAEDVDRRAILIERALPGQNLTEVFHDDKPASVKPAIDVLRSVLAPAPTPSDKVLSLDKWFDNFRQRYPGTSFPADYSIKALDIYDKLSGQPNRTFYLHGDFHPGNMVSSTRAPFLVIDPKGSVGHIGYDIAVFLNNFHWWQETEPDLRVRLDRAVGEFADAFDIDPADLRQWAFAQMVIGAWWNFEDMPEFYDNSVVKADIWDV